MLYTSGAFVVNFFSNIFRLMMEEKYFDDIYKEYKNTVFNLCLNYLLNPEDAQDATQEVFVKAFQRYHQFNSQAASLKTWICRIAINQCLDFLKAKRTNKRFGFLTSLFHGDTNEPVEQIVNINHPGIAAEDKEGLENLLHIIFMLPTNQKTVIILTKIEGHSLQEVASIMNTSVKAVESLSQRAKHAITKKINAAEGL